MEFTTEAIRSRVFLCWEVFDSWLNLLNGFSLDLMQHFISVLGHEEGSPSTTPATRVSAVSHFTFHVTCYTGCCSNSVSTVSCVTFHVTCYTGRCSVPCHLPRHLLTRVAAVSRVTFHITCYMGQHSVLCHLPRHLLQTLAQCPVSLCTSPVTSVSTVFLVTFHVTCYMGQRSVPEKGHVVFRHWAVPLALWVFGGGRHEVQ